MLSDKKKRVACAIRFFRYPAMTPDSADTLQGRRFYSFASQFSDAVVVARFQRVCWNQP